MSDALSMPRLSIVIVTYNSSGYIDTCLASLVQHAPSIDHEVVLVDNASPDGTAAAVRSRWRGVRVIDAGANVGRIAAGSDSGSCRARR